MDTSPLRGELCDISLNLIFKILDYLLDIWRNYWIYTDSMDKKYFFESFMKMYWDEDSWRGAEDFQKLFKRVTLKQSLGLEVETEF